jgi:predicted transcriptional regulator
MELYKKILTILKKKKNPCTQAEIAKEIGEINRAILLGYLRCMVDLGRIKSRMGGRTLIYYL